MKPIIKIVNATTGEEIEREMNDIEFSDWQAQQSVFESRKAEAEAKATARQAILDRLGLTEDEVKILLG